MFYESGVDSILYVRTDQGLYKKDIFFWVYRIFRCVSDLYHLVKSYRFENYFRFLSYKVGNFEGYARSSVIS